MNEEAGHGADGPPDSREVDVGPQLGTHPGCTREGPGGGRLRPESTLPHRRGLSLSAPDGPQDSPLQPREDRSWASSPALRLGEDLVGFRSPDTQQSGQV